MTPTLAPPRRSGELVVQNFEKFLTQRSERQRIDKIDDLAQRRIDERAIAADLADTEFGPLPHIVIGRLGDRDVELVAHAILDRAQHVTLALERMVIRQE